MHKSGNSKTIISVIICTYNRCKNLRDILESISFQEINDKFDYEIVLVDNNSNDNTKNYVTNYSGGLKGRLHYFFENNQGLSWARNRGVAESIGEIIVFTDDDMILNKDYLFSIFSEFKNKEIDVITGRTELFDKTGFPLATISREIKQIYHYPCEFWNLGYGNNFAARKSVFSKTGFFDTRLGAGTKINAGEDIDMIYRILKVGYSVLYSPNVRAFHNHARKKYSDILKTWYCYGKGAGAIYVKYCLNFDYYIIKSTYWQISYLIKKIIFSKGKVRKVNIRYFQGFLLGCFYMFSNISLNVFYFIISRHLLFPIHKIKHKKRYQNA